MFSPEALENPLFQKLLTEWALAKCTYQVAHLKHEERVAKSLQYDRRRRIAKRRHHFERLQEREVLSITRSSRTKHREETEKCIARIQFLARKYFDIWCQHVKGKKGLCNDSDSTYRSVWDVTDAMRTMNDYLLRTCDTLDTLKSQIAITHLEEKRESREIASQIEFLIASNKTIGTLNSFNRPRRVSIKQPQSAPPEVLENKSLLPSASILPELQEKQTKNTENKQKRAKSSPRCGDKTYRFFQPCRRSKIYDITCGGCYPLERWRATECDKVNQRPLTPVPCCFQRKSCTVCYEEPCNPCRTVKPISIRTSPEGVCFESACMQYLKGEYMADISATKCGTKAVAKCSTKRPIIKRKTCFKSVTTPTQVSSKLVCDLNKSCKKRPRKRTCSTNPPTKDEPKCPPIRIAYLSKNCQVPAISSHPLFKTSCSVREHFTQTKPKIKKIRSGVPLKDARTKTASKPCTNSYTEPTKNPTPVNKLTQTPENIQKQESKPHPRRLARVPITTASQTDPKKLETTFSQTPAIIARTVQTNKPPDASTNTTQTDKPANQLPKASQTALTSKLIQNDTPTDKPAKVAPKQTQTVIEVIPQAGQTENLKADAVSSQTHAERIFSPKPTQTEPRKGSEIPIQTETNTPVEILPYTSQNDPTPTTTPNFTQTNMVNFSPETTQTETKEPVFQPVQTKSVDFANAFEQADKNDLNSTPVQTEYVPPAKVFPQTTQTPEQPAPAKLQPQTQQTEIHSFAEEVQSDLVRTYPETTQTLKPAQEVSPVKQIVNVPPNQHLEIQTEPPEFIPQPTQTENLRLSPRTSQTNPPPSFTPKPVQTDTTNITAVVTQTNTPPDTRPKLTQTELKTISETNQYEPEKPLEQEVQTKRIETSPQQSQTESAAPDPKPAEAQTDKPPESTGKPTQTPTPEPNEIVTQTPVDEIPKTTDSHVQAEPRSKTVPIPSQTESDQRVSQDSQTIPAQTVPQIIQTEQNVTSCISVEVQPPRNTQPSQSEPPSLAATGSQADPEPKDISPINIFQTQTVTAPLLTQVSQMGPQVTTPKIMQTEPPVTTSGFYQTLPVVNKAGTSQTDTPLELPQAALLESSPRVTQTDAVNVTSATTEPVKTATHPSVVQTERIQALTKVIQTQPDPFCPVDVQTVLTVTRSNYTQPEPFCSSPFDAAIQTERRELTPANVQANVEVETRDPIAAQTNPIPLIHQPVQTCSAIPEKYEINIQTCYHPSIHSTQTIEPCISVVQCQTNVPLCLSSSQTEKYPRNAMIPAITQSVTPLTNLSITQTDCVNVCTENEQTLAETPCYSNVQTVVKITRINCTEAEPLSSSTSRVQTEQPDRKPAVVQIDPGTFEPLARQTVPRVDHLVQTCLSTAPCNTQTENQTCQTPCQNQSIQSVVPFLAVIQCQQCNPLCLEGTQAEHPPSVCQPTQTAEVKYIPTELTIKSNQQDCQRTVGPFTSDQFAQICPPPKSTGECQSLEVPCAVQCLQTEVKLLSEKCYQVEPQVVIEDWSQTPCPPGSVHRGQQNEPPLMVCAHTYNEIPNTNDWKTDVATGECTQTATTSSNTAQSQTKSCTLSMIAVCTDTPYSKAHNLIQLDQPASKSHCQTEPEISAVTSTATQILKATTKEAYQGSVLCPDQSVQTILSSKSASLCQTHHEPQCETQLRTNLPPVKICVQTEPSHKVVCCSHTKVIITSQEAEQNSCSPLLTQQWIQTTPKTNNVHASQTGEPVRPVECNNATVYVQTPGFGLTRSSAIKTTEYCHQTKLNQQNMGLSQTDASKCVHILTHVCPPCLQENSDQTEIMFSEMSAQTEKPCEESATAQTEQAVENSSQVGKPCQKDEGSQGSVLNEASSIQTHATSGIEQQSQKDVACVAEETAQTCQPIQGDSAAQTELTSAAGQTEQVTGCEGIVQTQSPRSVAGCAQTILPCLQLVIRSAQTSLPCYVQANVQTLECVQDLASAQTDELTPCTEEQSQTIKSCPDDGGSQTVPAPISQGVVQTESNDETTETEAELSNLEFVQTETPASQEKAVQIEGRAEDCSQTPRPPGSVHRGQGNEPLKLVCVQTFNIPPCPNFCQTKSAAIVDQCFQTDQKLSCTSESPSEMNKPQMINVYTNPCCLQSHYTIQTDSPTSKLCAQTEPQVVTVNCISTQITQRTKEASENSVPVVCPEQSVQTVLLRKRENTFICQTICVPPCETQIQAEPPVTEICTQMDPAPISMTCTSTQIIVPTKEAGQNPSPPAPVQQCVQAIPDKKPGNYCQTMQLIPCIQYTQTEIQKPKICAEINEAALPIVESTPTQTLIVKTEACTEAVPAQPTVQCIQTCPQPRPAIDSQTCGPCCLVCVQTEACTRPVICCQTCVACQSQLSQTTVPATKVCAHTEPINIKLKSTSTQLLNRTKDSEQSHIALVDQCDQILPTPKTVSICQTCDPICCIVCAQTQFANNVLSAETQSDLAHKSCPTQIEFSTKETSQGQEPRVLLEQCHQIAIQKSQPVNGTQTCKPPCCVQVVQTVASSLPVIECQTCLPGCIEATQTDQSPSKINVPTQPDPRDMVCTPTQVTTPTQEFSQGLMLPAPIDHGVQTCLTSNATIAVQICKPPCIIQPTQTAPLYLPQKSFQTEAAKKIENCCQTPGLPETIHRGEGKDPLCVISVQTCCEPTAYNLVQTDLSSADEQCGETVRNQLIESQSQTYPCLPHVTTFTSSPCSKEVCYQTENNSEADISSQTEKPVTSSEIAQTVDTNINFSSQMDKPCTIEQFSQIYLPNTKDDDAQISSKSHLEQFSENDPLCTPDGTSQTCAPTAEPTFAQTESFTVGDQTEVISDCDGFAQTQPPCPDHVFTQTLSPRVVVCCVETIRPCHVQSIVQTRRALGGNNCTQTEIAPVLENYTQLGKPCAHEQYLQTVCPHLKEENAQTEYNNETTGTTPTQESDGCVQTDMPNLTYALTQSQDNSNKDVQTSPVLLAEECAQVEQAYTVDNIDQTCSPNITEHCAQTEQNEEFAQTDNEVTGEISLQTERRCPAGAAAQTSDPEGVGRSDQTNELAIQEGFTQMMTPCPIDYFTQTCSPPLLETHTQAEFINSECLQTESLIGTPVYSQTYPKLQIIQCVQTVVPCPVHADSQTLNPVFVPCYSQSQVLHLEGYAQTTPVCLPDQCVQTNPPIKAEEFAQTEIKVKCVQTEKGPELNVSAQTEKVCPIDTSHQTLGPTYDIQCSQTDKYCPEDKQAETIEITSDTQCAQTGVTQCPEQSEQTEPICPSDGITQTCSPESAPQSAQTYSNNLCSQTLTIPGVESSAQTDSKSAEVGEQTCQPEIAEGCAQTYTYTICSQTEPVSCLEHTTQVSPYSVEGTSQTLKPPDIFQFAQTTQKCTAEQTTMTKLPMVADAFVQGEYKHDCLQTEPVCTAEMPSQTDSTFGTDQSHQTCATEVVDACGQLEFHTEGCQTEIPLITTEALTQTELPNPCDGVSQTCPTCRSIRCTQTCIKIYAECFTQTANTCPAEKVVQTEQASLIENCTQTVPKEHLQCFVQTKPPCPHGQQSQTDPTPKVETSIETVLVNKTGTPTQTNDEVEEPNQTEMPCLCEEFTQTDIPIPANLFVQTGSIPTEQCCQTVLTTVALNCCQTVIVPCDEVCLQTDTPAFAEICTKTETLPKCNQATQSESPPRGTSCSQVIVPETCTQTHHKTGTVRCAQTVSPIGTNMFSQSAPAKEAWAQGNEAPDTRPICVQTCKSLPFDCCKTIQTSKLYPSKNMAVDCCYHIHTKLNSCQANTNLLNTACCSMQTHCCKPKTISVVCSCPDIRTLKNMETYVNSSVLCCSSMQTLPCWKPKTFSVVCGGSLPNKNPRAIDIQTCPTTCCTSIQTPICRKPKTTSIICGNSHPCQQTLEKVMQTLVLNPTCCTSKQTSVYSKPNSVQMCDKPKTVSIDCGNQPSNQPRKDIDVKTGETTNTGTYCVLFQMPICCKNETMSADAPSSQQAKAIDIQTWANNQACCGNTIQISCRNPQDEVNTVVSSNANPNEQTSKCLNNATTASSNTCAKKQALCNNKTLSAVGGNIFQSRKLKIMDIQTCTVNPSVCCRATDTPAFPKIETKTLECNRGHTEGQTISMIPQAQPVNPSVCCKWMNTSIFNPSNIRFGSSSVQTTKCPQATTPTLITMNCKYAQLPVPEHSNKMSNDKHSKPKLNDTETSASEIKSYTRSNQEPNISCSFPKPYTCCSSQQEKIYQDIQYTCIPEIVCSTQQQTVNVPCQNFSTQSPAVACPTVRYPSATQLQHLMYRTMRNLLAPRNCVTTSNVRNISATGICQEAEDEVVHITPPANVFAETVVLKALSGCPDKVIKELQAGTPAVTNNVVEDIVVKSSQLSLVGDVLTERAVLRVWKTEGANRKEKEHHDQATSPLLTAGDIDYSNCLEESEHEFVQVYEENHCPDRESVSDKLSKIKTQLTTLKESLAKEGIGVLQVLDNTSPTEVLIIPEPDDTSPPANLEISGLNCAESSHSPSTNPRNSILKSNKPTPRSSKSPVNVFKKSSNSLSARKVRISGGKSDLKQEAVPEVESSHRNTVLESSNSVYPIQKSLPENCSNSEQTVKNPIVHANDSSRALFEHPLQPGDSQKERSSIPGAKSWGFEISDGPNASQSSTQVLMRPNQNMIESQSTQLIPEEREDQEALKTWAESIDAEAKKKLEIQERLKNVREQVDLTREELERRGIINHSGSKNKKQQHHTKKEKKK